MSPIRVDPRLAAARNVLDNESDFVNNMQTPWLSSLDYCRTVFYKCILGANLGTYVDVRKLNAVREYYYRYPYMSIGDLVTPTSLVDDQQIDPASGFR